MSVLLKQQLAKAQNRMNQYADLHRIKRQFEEKGLVFLTLQPYRQQSLEGRRNYKLSPRFYGPSEVEGKTSLVASWLKLPEQARTYSVFPCILTKKNTFHGSRSTLKRWLTLTGNGSLLIELEVNLQKRTIY